MRMFVGLKPTFRMKDVKYFLLEAIYDTLILICTLNMNCYEYFNRLVVVISDTVDVHWQRPGVNRHIQRNVFYTKLLYISI